MRVAYLINQYPKVSHSFIRREIHALERLGFDIFRIALRGWDHELADPDDLAERAKTNYVLQRGPIPLTASFCWALFTQMPGLMRALRSAWRFSRRSDRPLLVHLIYVAEAAQILRWIKARDITHLHAHFGTNTAEIACFVRLLGGPPWSFTVHGPEEFDKIALMRMSEKIKSSAFVIAISSFTRSQLYRNIAFDDWTKIHVVRCGLEPAFYREASQLNPDNNTFICVGRLCEQKGQLLLVEAIRQLRDNGVDCRLVLAGDGELRPEIERLVTQYKLAKNIRITGWISSEQVKNEILASRALVLPSFAEGLPVVLMEAMSLQRPVISTFVAGIPELVKPGRNGWLVPAGDVDRLMSALSDCLQRPATALSELGRAGYDDVVQAHDINTECSKLAALLRSSQSPAKQVNANE